MVGGSSPPGPAKNVSFIMNLKQNLQKIINEFKKIEWPSKRDVIILSAMVVFISGVISIYLGIFDLLFTSFLGRIGIL